MKKFLLVLLLVAAVFSALAEEKVTLKFLWYLDATSPGFAEDQAVWDKFKADNPDIDLEMETLFNEPFHQKVSAYIASNQLPDVMFMWPSGRSTELHSQKLLKDLKPLLGDAFLNKFIPAVINPKNQSSGYLAELPQAVTYTTAMFANKALIEKLGMKLPKTYAELKAMVPKLKAKGIAAVMMANKDTWVMQSCLFSTISGRLAGDDFIDKVKAGKAKFTDKAFVSALNFVAALYKDSVLSNETLQIGYGEVPGLFADGKAAFMIDGDWRVGDFLTDKATGKALIPPARQKSDYVIMNFPAIPGEISANTCSAIVGTGLGISAAIPKGSAKEKAAVRLLQYYYSDAVLKTRLETGAFIPSKKGITSDKIEPLTAKISAYYATIDKTTYVLDGVLDESVYTPLNNGLQEIGLGTKTPAQVAEEVQAAMDTWISAHTK
jgi:raffinose/stachyose/melibiose transport system substrate-binding protein